MMEKQERAALIKSLSDVIRDYVAQSIVDVKAFLSGELQALSALFEERVAAIPAGRPGERGIDGKDGQDGAPGKDGKDGKDGELGKPGERGDKGDPADLTPFEAVRREWEERYSQLNYADAIQELQRTIAALPKEAIRGEKGAPGERGEKGERGLDGSSGRDGIDGKDGSPGKDGLDGKPGSPGERGEKAADGKDGRDGRDGKDGRDGERGRDALDIEILPAVDLSKSYPRGTFAKHRGGLIRAIRNTEQADTLEKSGWDVLIEGLHAIDVIASEDLRTITIRHELTSGVRSINEFTAPQMLHRGVYRAGTEYVRGDTVTQQGSCWLCVVDRTAIPPATPNVKDWQLVVKAGRDGRDGKDGQSAEPVRLK